MTARLFVTLVLFAAAVWPPYTLFSVWCGSCLFFVIGHAAGRVSERRAIFEIVAREE